MSRRTPHRKLEQPIPRSLATTSLATTSLATTLLTVILIATACGGGSDTGTADGDGGGLVFQGEQNVDVDDTTTTTEAPDAASAGAGEGGGAPTFDETTDTIPTGEEEDAEGEFFDAVGGFMGCLQTEGYRFIGIPNEEAGETDPVNDPGYREALGGCAASTQIVDKMRAAEDSSDMTAEEIEVGNRQFGEFVDCLKGRGWTIPPLTPDENGVLQTPYIEIARTWLTPDGSSLLSDDSFNTDDFAECGLSLDALN